MKKIRIFICLLIVTVLIIIVILRLSGNKVNYIDLIQYEEQLLGIKIRDCVEAAEGNVMKIFGEDYAYVQFKIKKNNETQILDLIRSICGEPKKIEEVLPHRLLYDDEYVENIKDEVESAYFTCREGNKEKTRIIYILIVYDQYEQLYVHIIG